MDVDKTVEAIFSLFDRYGSGDYLGEPISQTEHMVQCAMLAEQEGGTPQEILGALFHDIGHLAGKDYSSPELKTDEIILGIKGHGDVGKQFLDGVGVPHSISVFVKGHVDAKRYLVYKDKDYYDKLSKASKMTLVHQGGPMTSEEAEAFETNPQLDSILKVRTWDERAKDPNVTIQPLKKYRDMCRDVLLAEKESQPN